MYYLLLQLSSSEIAAYIDRFGISVVISGLLIIFFWKKVIPSWEKQHEKVVDILNEQIKLSTAVREREVEKFEQTVKEISAANNRAVEKFSHSMDILMAEIRAGRRVE